MTIQKLQLDKTASGHDAEAQMLERLGLADLKKKEGRTEEVIDTVSMYKKAGRGSTLYGIAGGSLGAVGGAELAGAFTDSATIKLLSAIAGGAGGAWAGAKAGDAIERDGGFKVTDEDDGAARHAATAMGITGGSVGWALSKYLMGNKGYGSHALAAALGAAAGGGVGYLAGKTKKEEDTNGVDPITQKQIEYKKSYHNNGQIKNQDGSTTYVSSTGDVYVPIRTWPDGKPMEQGRPIIFTEDGRVKLVTDKGGRNRLGTNGDYELYDQVIQDGRVVENTYDPNGKLIRSTPIYTIEKYDPKKHTGRLVYGYENHPLYKKWRAKYKDEKDHSKMIKLLNTFEEQKSENSAKPLMTVYESGKLKLRPAMPVDYDELSDEAKKYVDDLRNLGYTDEELHTSYAWPSYKPYGRLSKDYLAETVRDPITQGLVYAGPQIGLLINNRFREPGKRYKGFYTDNFSKIVDGLAGSTNKGVRNWAFGVNDKSPLEAQLAKLEIEDTIGNGKLHDYTYDDNFHSKNVNDRVNNVVTKLTEKYKIKARIVPDSVAEKFTGIPKEEIIKLRQRGYSIVPDNIESIKQYVSNNSGSISKINDALTFKSPNGRVFVFNNQKLVEALLSAPDGTIDAFNTAKQYLSSEFDLSHKDSATARKLLNSIADGKYKVPTDSSGKIDVDALKSDLLGRVYHSKLRSVKGTDAKAKRLRAVIYTDYKRRAASIGNKFTTGADIEFTPNINAKAAKYKVGSAFKSGVGGYELIDPNTNKSTGLRINNNGTAIMDSNGKIIGINVDGKFVNSTAHLDKVLKDLPKGKVIKIAGLEVRKAPDGTLEYKERKSSRLRRKAPDVGNAGSPDYRANIQDGWTKIKAKGGRTLKVGAGIGSLLAPWLASWAVNKINSTYTDYLDELRQQ